MNQCANNHGCHPEDGESSRAHSPARETRTKDLGFVFVELAVILSAVFVRSTLRLCSVEAQGLP